MVAAATAMSAQTVMFTDLGPSNNLLYDLVTANGPLGQSFSTASAYQLTSVSLTLSNQNSIPPTAAPVRGGKPAGSHKNGPGAAAVSVSLWTFTASGPGTLIATSPTIVPDTSLTSTAQTFTFTFPSTQLAANTRYWLVLTGTGGTVAIWRGTDTPAGPVTSEFQYDVPFGVNPVSPGGGLNSFAFFLAVSGIGAAPVTTPAPPSSILVLIGLCGVGLYFGRRQFARSI
jgi:hypothetical protein